MNGKTHPRRGLHGRKGIGDVHRGQERVYDIEAQAVAAALPAPGEVWTVERFKQAADFIVRDRLALVFDHKAAPLHIDGNIFPGLDRANLSLANGWQDNEGQIYIVFPVCKIANAVDRSPMTVKNALTELETVGLIERRRHGFSQPNRIYVKIPDGQDIVLLTDKKLSHRGKETCPTDGQKVVPMTDRKLSPNNMSNNNLRNSNLSGVSERPPAWGRYENVFLTEAEVAELQADFPTVWQEYIERLSEYMASTGKTYKSHAATIRRWAKEDRRKGKGVADYSCKESESL